MTLKSIREQVIFDMKKLNIYDVSFNKIIDIYASLLYSYQQMELQWKKNKFVVTEQYTNKNGSTNLRKTPLYQSLETMRKDILSYSNQLGLNPTGLKRLKDGNLSKSRKPSKLDKLFGETGT